MKPAEPLRIIRISDGNVREVDDIVATEKRLRIKVNGEEIIKLFCSPVMIRELVVGFFMTEGIIKGGFCAERISIEYGEEIVVDVPAEGEVSLEGSTITSGCVGGITFDKGNPEEEVKPGPYLSSEQLRELFRKFQTASGLYSQTGCIHSAAVSNGRDIIVLAEDIGRHNAVDKAIGYCLLENIGLDDKIMLVSGRLSSEMASKCSRWAIPIVISRTAPTERAVRLAKRRGITMIGFMRGARFNIYSRPERILS